jgi:hypothetical protein
MLVVPVLLALLMIGPLLLDILERRLFRGKSTMDNEP